MSTSISKYRVTFRTFSEYVPYGKFDIHGEYPANTNVHTVRECDVFAANATEAIAFAAQAFGKDAERSGDWKVKMLGSGGYKTTGATGSYPDRSTLVIAADMGT